MYVHVNYSSLVATLTLSIDCRAFIEYPDSRKIFQPSHPVIFSEHPIFTGKQTKIDNLKEILFTKSSVSLSVPTPSLSSSQQLSSSIDFNPYKQDHNKAR